MSLGCCLPRKCCKWNNDGRLPAYGSCKSGIAAVDCSAMMCIVKYVFQVKIMVKCPNLLWTARLDAASHGVMEEEVGRNPAGKHDKNVHHPGRLVQRFVGNDNGSDNQQNEAEQAVDQHKKELKMQWV
jgi:hypothetical protein